MAAQTTQKLKQLPAVSVLQKAFARAVPALLWLASAGVAFLAARAPVFGTLRPLAVSFAAAVTAPYALFACAGAGVGYALALPLENAVPYLAGVLAVALTRLLAAPRRQKVSPYAPAAAGALCCFVTGSGMALLSERGVLPIFLSAAESMILAGLAYLFADVLTQRRTALGAQDTEGTAALLVTAMAGLCCLVPYTVAGVNLGVLCGAGACLYFALCRGENGAALCGTAVCAAVCVSAPQLLYAGVGIAVAGVAAAYFGPGNRVLTAIIFWAAGFLGVPAAPVGTDGLMYMITLALAALAVCALPEPWLQRTRTAAVQGGRSTLVALSGRLSLLSDSLSSIGTTLAAVCAKLPRKGESYADVCDAVTDTVCKHCAKCTACWAQNASDAYDAFNNLQPILERAGCVTAADLPMPLQSSCLHASRLMAVLSTAYNAYVARRAAYTRGEAMRSAITEQYSAMASALAGLSSQVYREEIPDKRKARRVEQLFADIGVEPFETLVATDCGGRLYVNLRLPRVSFTDEELSLLTKELSTLCRCKMGQGVCRQTAASTMLTFAQAALFEPETGRFSLPAQGRVCADAVKAFTDANGFFHLLLCDGMGTGKAAAVDGTLAATLCQRLLTGGFGAAETARLVNVAMSLKGEADSAATLDVLSINLFTGAAQLFKAGAAASFLVRQGVVTLLGGDSLPIGILASVSGRTDSLQLQRGDLLIVVSDGAAAGDPDWICAELTCAQLPAPQELAQQLAEKARTRSARPDDITVVCLSMAAKQAAS